MLPTVTPTLTPTPTATPVIVPTSQPPVAPPETGSLSFLLPALRVALFGLLIVAAIVGIGMFIWWWWEWRGMRGLSPVVRAYKRLERYLTGLLGIPLAGQLTPDERQQRIIADMPRRAHRPINAITRLYTAEKYGPAAPERVPPKRVNRAWSSTRTTILEEYGWRFVPFARFFKRDKRK